MEYFKLISFAKDGKHLVSGCTNAALKVTDVVSKPHTVRYNSFVFSKSKMHIVVLYTT